MEEEERYVQALSIASLVNCSLLDTPSRAVNFIISCDGLSMSSDLLLRRTNNRPWLPFAFGFFAASLAWNSLALFYYHKISSGRDEDEGDSDEDSKASHDVSDLSKSLMRWPWDRIRKTIQKSVLSPFLNIEYFEDSSDNSVKANDKHGPCIGEIFGLDVGGTLTKLVYFEEQAHEYKRTETHEQGLNRHERYTNAASAREVLKARRESNKLHDADSDKDLQGLIGARQESVPDRLDEYANTYQGKHVQKDENVNVRIGMKRSSSMSTLSKSMMGKKEEALDSFYSFASKLDTYDTAVKDKHLSYYSKYLQGTFHFIRFETRRMGNAMQLMLYNDFHLNIKEIGATGGGAHKFADMWESVLGITMSKQGEMDSLVAGMQFVMCDIDGECYTFKPCDWEPETDDKGEDNELFSSMLKPPTTPSEVPKTPNYKTQSASSAGCEEDIVRDSSLENPLHPSEIPEERRPLVDQWWTSKKVQREPVTSDPYPYLLVSIGTGVSILRVDGPRKHERISGSTIGGGTYWGLCRLLTGSDSFSAVLDLASKGDPTKIDMMVGDIYGEGSNALEKLGLKSDIVASSFGKLVSKQNPSEGIKEEDLARALLLMVTNNIGQVAHLNAKLYKTSRIYFVGTFLQHNIISQQRLAYSIDYWSQGKMEALFLEHEAYFGALGAFLLNHGIEHKKQVVPRKKRHAKADYRHQRSKSMGSIQFQQL